jgi:hypothetical protein
MRLCCIHAAPTACKDEHNSASTGYTLTMGRFIMAMNKTAISSALAIAFAMSLSATVAAQTTATPAAPKAAAKKPAANAAAKAPAVAYVPAAADKDQVDAADRVYYGVYDCEFNQTLNIAASSKYPAYVEVKHLKADYLMKPVLSTTGAIRLEDTKGEALMVQIANKSMLLNTKTGQRVVDDCVSPKQRELIAAAQAAKAAGGQTAGASMFQAGASTSK